MKIAVVIGISRYENLEPLSACENDAKNIVKLLKATGEYAEVFALTQETEARRIKSSFIDFFDRHKGKKIDEVFFYFSGHGTYVPDNVLFCCSDFDPKYPSSTSLSNQEIDEYIRTINPELTVKLLDSCNSGVRYIKATGDNLEKAIMDTGINRFICMASSGFDQLSFASDKMSDFTKSFIEGVFSIEEGKILYRDIQNYISDIFIDKPEQTPQFVTQVTGLEVFTSVNTALKALKSSLEVEKEKLPEDLETSINNQIEKMESIFVPFDTVSESLETLQSTLSSMKLEDPLVSKYYNYEFLFKNDLNSLVNMRTIATWAYDRKWNQFYFVDINMEKERRTYAFDLGVMGIMAQSAVFGMHELTKDKQKDRPDYGRPEYRVVNVPTRITSTHPLAFEVIEIIAKPMKRALKQFGAMIGIVHSRTDVLVLSTTLEYKDVGWDERMIDTSTVKWRLKELKWKDIISNPIIIASDVLPQVEKDISDYLKFLVTEELTVLEQKEISEAK